MNSLNRKLIRDLFHLRGQVVARIDRSLFLYPVGGRYDMLEWL